MIMNKIIISLTFVFLLAGCATGGFQADVVARDAAGKPQFVQTGTVMSVQAVTIEAIECRHSFWDGSWCNSWFRCWRKIC